MLFDPLQFEVAVAIVIINFNISVLYCFSSPVENLLLLSRLESRVVDSVVVVFEVGEMARVATDKSDDAVSVAVLIGLHGCGVANVASVHGGERYARIELFEFLESELVSAAAGVRHLAAIDLVGVVGKV